MSKFFENMKIKAKLNVGYLIVIAFLVISAVISIVGMSAINSEFNNYINTAQEASLAIKNARIYMNIGARTVREMIINGDESKRQEYTDKLQESIAVVDEQIAIMERTGAIPEETLRHYTEQMEAWTLVVEDIVGAVVAGKMQTAADMVVNECTPALTAMATTAQEIDALTDEIEVETIQQTKFVFTVVVIIVVAATLLAVAFAFLIAKAITKAVSTPVQEIEDAAQDLQKGNLHTRIDYSGRDELGSAAASLNEAFHVLSLYIDDITSAMEAFTAGNFAYVPKVQPQDWRGDFISIASSFEGFMDTMADAVKGIQSVAVQVKSGSDQVSQSSMDLAQGATEQASITQELAATIEMISQQVAQNAESANQISEQVVNVGEEIVNGNSKMQEMVQSMREIDSAAQEIGKIIATINDIASQTNLLALNASIEAARAGEAGRGFAVVADQVSVLAAQSSDAAKDSTVLIESSLKAVEKGMVIADDTAKQLENVVEGSKVITSAVNQVAEALSAQEESFTQINHGVDNINDVVQTNSATSEECAAASQEMNSQANTLEGLIRRFTVR